MRILQIHNRYRHLGGEDTVVANERRLLQSQGHEVEVLEVFNPEADPVGAAAKLLAGIRVGWSAEGVSRACQAVSGFAPNIVHFHNTFFVLSPAAVRAVRAMGVPVVQTLHNYRLLCANALLMRGGTACERCVAGSRLNAVRYACYRGSRAASAAIVMSNTIHQVLGTYRGKGIRLIALTEFARRLLLRGGVGENAVCVKPNFVFRQDRSPARTNRIIFVGRLSDEKGIDLVIDAWRRRSPGDWTLTVAGDGALRPLVEAAGHGVEYVGWIAADEVVSRVAAARFLVMGSRWYEGLPMTVLEAFSVGTPVILPRLGAMEELLCGETTGIGFQAGSVNSIACALQKAIDLGEAEWHGMSAAARQQFERAYSPEANYVKLMAIYRDVAADLYR